MKKGIILITLIALVTIFLLLVGSGCKKRTAPSMTTVSPLVSPMVSLLPSPSPEVNEFKISTPPSGLGNVTGVLIHYTFESPVAGAHIYLAPVITSDDEKMEMAKFDKAVAIGSQTDKNGRFVFQGIVPGRYALILGGAINDYLLTDYRTQDDVVFNLEADQTLEIGEVQIIPPEDTIP